MTEQIDEEIEYPEVRDRLRDMLERDYSKRRDLLRSGDLGGAYHGEMEEIHLQNARELRQLVEEHGWLDEPKVGEKGAEFAWIIVQHAISAPEFQRKMLGEIEESVEAGRVPGEHYAKLLDRIRFYEGKPQEYGTNFDWDKTRQLSPTEVRDPDNVDERRAEMGLGPIADQIETMRKRAERQNERPPRDLHAYWDDFDEWCKQVGWRD